MKGVWLTIFIKATDINDWLYNYGRMIELDEFVGDFVMSDCHDYGGEDEYDAGR